MRPSKLRRHSALGLSDGDPPVITSINQSLGDTLGGQTVVITGKKFSLPSPGVRFGTTPATSFVVNSDTQITAVAPAHSAGSGDISVSTQGGTSSPAAYEYWDPNVPILSTSFLEAGQYALAAGTGTWTKRTGANASGNVHPPADSPAGTPQFVYANLDTLDHTANQWDTLIGLSAAVGFTLAVSVDVASLPGPFSALVSDFNFGGALYLDTAGTSVPAVGAPQAVFAYHTGAGYQLSAVRVPSSGNVTLVFVRDVSGPSPVIRMTVDGVAYSTDLVVGDLNQQSFSGLYLGYNSGISSYPLNARYKAFVTAKQAWTPSEISKFYKWVASRHP